MPGNSVVIVPGEASGDLHASNLARELKQLDREIQLSGMGGENMRRAGIDILIDSSDLAVVGLVEVLANYRTIKGALNKLKKTITDTPPDLLILVDYQEFNQKLAAYAKSIGIKALFYIGPQATIVSKEGSLSILQQAISVLLLLDQVRNNVYLLDAIRPA